MTPDTSESSRTVLSLSGGMDSATMLAMALKTRHPLQVDCCVFRYGSKHNDWEIMAAYKVVRHYGLIPSLIDVRGVFDRFKSDLLLSGGSVPEGHYNDESMRRTVVPARNMIFASILAGYARSVGASDVWMGMHAGDHAIYPDCRPQFVGSMNRAMSDAFEPGEGVRLHAPLLHMHKKDILIEGLALGVPYHLTRTCYTPDELACGKCGSCRERLEAFAFVGVKDPLPYQGGEK